MLTEERPQLLGPLVAPNGDAFLATSAVLEVEYEDAVPAKARLEMDFDGYGEPVESLRMSGSRSLRP